MRGQIAITAAVSAAVGTNITAPNPIRIDGGPAVNNNNTEIDGTTTIYETTLENVDTGTLTLNATRGISFGPATAFTDGVLTLPSGVSLSLVTTCGSGGNQCTATTDAINISVPITTPGNILINSGSSINIGAAVSVGGTSNAGISAATGITQSAPLSAFTLDVRAMGGSVVSTATITSGNMLTIASDTNDITFSEEVIVVVDTRLSAANLIRIDGGLEVTNNITRINGTAAGMPTVEINSAIAVNSLQIGNTTTVGSIVLGTNGSLSSTAAGLRLCLMLMLLSGVVLLRWLLPKRIMLLGKLARIRQTVVFTLALLPLRCS